MLGLDTYNYTAWSYLLVVVPTRDHIKEITHPINVQPVKIFTSTMPKILLERLMAAIIVGRK